MTERVIVPRAVNVWKPIAVSCAAVALLSHMCGARTWRVNHDGSGDALTIQGAIDSANNGDEICVDPGTYYETIDFLGKTIRVRGADSHSTILDASPVNGPAVRFVSRESNEAVLEKLTITGGKGQRYGTALMGGGIIIDGAEPTLRYLRIVDNTAIGPSGSNGGGIQIFGLNWEHPAQPIIEDCEIAHNTAQSNGGGIGFNGLVAPAIRHCSIHNNTAVLGDGGGIWGSTGGGEIDVKANEILLNSAGDHGGGVHLAGTASLPLIDTNIEKNLIARNVANGLDSEDLTGGGLYLSFLKARVHSNTIVLNAANGGGGIVAGGIALRGYGDYDISLNIIAYTTQGYAIVCDDRSTEIIVNNLSWHNWGTGRLACADWVMAGGNLEADPLFCEPEWNNFAVQEGSPALKDFPEPIGYIASPGCKGRVFYTTWSALKSMIVNEGN